MTKDTPEKPDPARTQAGYGTAPGGLGTRPLSSVMRDVPGCLDELLPLMAKVVDAVAQAHRVHERPSNLDPRKILLHDDGSVGVVTHSQPAMGSTFALSSLKYVSPELLQDETSVNVAAADTYVLGFLFYELLLGHRLFDEQFKQVRQSGDAGWLIWHADQKSRATPAKQLLVEVPSFVSDTLEKMMAKSPSERMANLAAIGSIFGRSCEPTAIYKVMSRPYANGKPKSAFMSALKSSPRPWLDRLAKQRLWKWFWRRVTPDDPRPGWQSVQQLEQMLRRAESRLKRFGSTIPFPAPKKGARG